MGGARWKAGGRASDRGTAAAEPAIATRPAPTSWPPLPSPRTCSAATPGRRRCRRAAASTSRLRGPAARPAAPQVLKPPPPPRPLLELRSCLKLGAGRTDLPPSRCTGPLVFLRASVLTRAMAGAGRWQRGAFGGPFLLLETRLPPRERRAAGGGRTAPRRATPARGYGAGAARRSRPTPWRGARGRGGCRARLRAQLSRGARRRRGAALCAL